MKYKIYNQDVIEWAEQYSKGKFHALLSDAPYHLTSIVKRFGKKNSAPAQYGTDGVFSRASRGFMGQEWDGGDIAFRAETWEALGDHLYPGAFGMVFSASRNWHRLAVAIEDAGMIIHPTIFGWLNGQGFPKATNISKQLEKGRVIGQRQDILKKQAKDFERGYRKIKDSYDLGAPNRNNGFKTVSADILEFDSPMGKAWQGHRYGLQALKPAVEPIIVFQKPYDGRPLDNIIETGAGALNIDGGRIPTNEDDPNKRRDTGGYASVDSLAIVPNAPYNKTRDATLTQGRWPANFILDESVAPALDKQTGNLKAGKATANSGAMGYHGGRRGSTPEMTYADDGGASRFFFNVQQQIDEADPIYYCSKVSTSERNAGLDESFEEKRTDATYRPNDDGTKGIQSRLHGATVKGRNSHPTMKPITLAQYLATLLLPPEAYAPRRIMVPFSGVGSEMIGCALAGWEQIVGIEFDKEAGYVEMAHKRMEYWTTK